jgi:signal transduction histidine kinase
VESTALRPVPGRPQARTDIDPPSSIEVQIRLDERDRIARELHDSTSQLLVVLGLQLMRLKQSPSADPDAFDHTMDELSSTLAELHESVRDLVEDDFSPGELAYRVASMASDFAGRAQITIHTDIGNLPPNLPPKIAHAVYRVAQEALANSSRHSGAQNISLFLNVDSSSLILRVSDDGVGFARPLPERISGRGMANMAGRIKELGGRLTIRNLRRGASIRARFDLGSECIGTPFMLTKVAG